MRTLRLPDVINAAVDALTGDSTLSTLLGGAKAYTHVPEDTAPPYVELMAASEVAFDESTNDDLGSQCSIDGVIYSAYRGTVELTSVGNRIVQLWTDSAFVGLSGYVGRRWVEFRVLDDKQMVTGQIYRRAHVRIVVQVD